MRRFLQLNPYDFVRFLKQQGCVAGPRQAGLQPVFRQDDPSIVVMIRMGEPVDGNVIRAHLDNLRIAEELLEAYLGKPHRPNDD